MDEYEDMNFGPVAQWSPNAYRGRIVDIRRASGVNNPAQIFFVAYYPAQHGSEEHRGEELLLEDLQAGPDAAAAPA